MAEVDLARSYSAETHEKALDNLIERWKTNEGDKIKYDEAAIGMDKSTASKCLLFLSEINMIDSPSSGYYKIPPEVVDFIKKTGEVREEAKQKIVERVSEYELYKESKFIANVDEFTIRELAEEVAGSKNVAADKDEIDAVERSLEVLVQFELLETNEEGIVSQPSTEDIKPSQESSEDTSDKTDEGTSAKESTGESNEEKDYPEEDKSKLEINLEIQIDITDMEPDEIKKKLKSIRDSLNDGE